MSGLLALGLRELGTATRVARRRIDDALALPTRALSLMTSVEGLIARTHEVLDSIELTRADADRLIERAELTRATAAGVLAEVDAIVGEANALLDRYRPTLARLAPLVDRLATPSPTDAEALGGLVQRLPTLAEKVESDVLPIMDALRSVGPDLHRLLGIADEFDDVLGHVPLMGRLKRRLESEADGTVVDGRSPGRPLPPAEP